MLDPRGQLLRVAVGFAALFSAPVTAHFASASRGERGTILAQRP
jgi:hypothetical protein